MDPGNRRRATARPQGALRLGLILVLAFVLGRWALSPWSGEAAGGEVSTVAAAAPAPVSSPRKRYDELVAIDSELQATLDRIVADALRPALKKDLSVSRRDIEVTFSVRELGSALEVAARDPERALRPASCLKLVTTAASLVLLGPDFQFETTFETQSDIVGGTLRGDLVVRAGADPLYHPEGRIAKRFEHVVSDLRRAGIERIEGRLVLDEASFADPAPGPAWPSQKQHWHDYCALSGGFSAAAGCLTAFIECDGDRPVLHVFPRNHGLRPRFDVRYGPRNTMVVGASGGRVTVRGELPRSKKPWTSSFAHPDPVELFGAVLRGALADGGITLGGDVVRERGVAPGGRILSRLNSPLADLLVPINTESHNATADQVFLAVGRAVEGAGSRAAGERATARALEQLGLDPSGLIQIDGSGLSRDNRVTARQLAALLHAVLDRADGASEAYFDSLARAAETGTLEDRMDAPELRGRVRAKSGWISGTSALSGVALTDSGRRLAFSILVSYPRRLGGWNKYTFKPMQDAMCVAMVTRDSEQGDD